MPRNLKTKPLISAEDDPRFAFVTTDLSLRQLFERMKGKPGCGQGTLFKRSTAEKWMAQREEFRRRVEAGAAQLAVARDLGLVTDESGTVTFEWQPKVGAPATVPLPVGVAAAAIYDQAYEAMLAAKSEELAKKRLKDADEIAAVRDTLLDNAKVLASDAAKILVSDKIRLTEDGYAEINATTFSDRDKAVRLHNAALDTINRMAGFDPLAVERMRREQERAARAQSEYYELRNKGMLPPDKHAWVGEPSVEDLHKVALEVYNSPRFGTDKKPEDVTEPAPEGSGGTGTTLQ